MVGAALILLGAVHPTFPRYFGWKAELQRVSLLTRQVFLVHLFFIALLLIGFGGISLIYADALLQPTALSRGVLIGMVVFWLCRLFVQFAVYDPAIWRGHTFYTTMHVVFSVFWTYAVLVYGFALRAVL
jgi:hypothetical protein